MNRVTSSISNNIASNPILNEDYEKEILGYNHAYCPCILQNDSYESRIFNILLSNLR